jgi:hypothetical protein
MARPLLTEAVLSFKSICIGRSPDLRAKLIVQDSPVVQSYLNMTFILHILFLLVLDPWLILELMLLYFFLNYIDPSISKLLIHVNCCFKFKICYLCILEYCCSRCFVLGFCLMLIMVWYRCTTSTQ